MAPRRDSPLHPVIIVGAGPVGLTLAIDLAQRGVRVVLLDAAGAMPAESRAICYAQRTLEIWDRLGCGEAIAAHGVSWNTGRLFFRDAQVYAFDLQREAGQRRPAFVNLPQYRCEERLAARARELDTLEIRRGHVVRDVRKTDDRVALDVETPDGGYEIEARYVVACDGARSTVRRALGLESTGRAFLDRFLIVDVRMRAGFPAERWFWFDPPFHRNRSVLLHMQPENLWRIDFQLGADADPDEEQRPERVAERVQALLGPDTAFELAWTSVYTFTCKRMQEFRHGRVLFAGDAAHGVSPFGARGANSGVQDADNLGWKLGSVLENRATEALLDTYAREREAAADENILHSTRSTDFITPKSAASRDFRDAVLGLAKKYPFARRLLNSGRLSQPTVYVASPLNTPDVDTFAGTMVPGAPACDAPVTVDGVDDWFLAHAGGDFCGVIFGADAPADAASLRLLRVVPAGVTAPNTLVDRDGLLQRRYDAEAGTFYLLRPDQHVCARTRRLDAHWLAAALARASGHIDSGATTA